MSTGTIIASVIVLAVVLFVFKKKSGCCSHKPEAGKGEGHDKEKGGCCGGH